MAAGRTSGRPSLRTGNSVDRLVGVLDTGRPAEEVISMTRAQPAPNSRLPDRVRSWATDLDDATLTQAARTARLPIVAGHVALMPDAHLGIGATVGSVIPTDSAIIPAAVGVDIGCGMAAVRTDLAAHDLPDTLEPMLGAIASAVPAGVGREQSGVVAAAERWFRAHRPRTELDDRLVNKTLRQFGTLGSGNHFVEVCLDQTDTVWIVLHSGSRGVGNQLAQRHIATARSVARRSGLRLEDPDLAYFLEGTAEFDHYMADLVWAQDYARANRDAMMDAVLRAVFGAVGRGSERERVNCHHNYTERETHFGRELWITRKGAIRAGVGDRGIVPGSMGTATYITVGLGNDESYHSCSHGAGRRLSRTAARKTFTAGNLRSTMQGRTWLVEQADRLLDEHPGAYKDIDEVMANQADLVEVTHALRQVLNYKGT